MQNNVNKLEQKVRDIAKQNNIELILWGTGADVYEPCVIAVSTDFLQFGYRGYNVWVYPEGQGYGKPATLYEVTNQ